MQQLYQSPAFQSTVEQILTSKGKFPHLINHLDGAARAIFIAQLVSLQDAPVLVIEPDILKLNQLISDLESLLPDKPVLLYSEEDTLAGEFALGSLDLMAMRVESLRLLATNESGVVVSDVSAARKWLTEPSDWLSYQGILTVGEDYERQALIERLDILGYQREAMVMSPGEYSIRGSIIDYYPLNATYPIRLDFFDTELDSIRQFDVDTQESIENLESSDLLAARDVIWPIDNQLTYKEKLKALFNKQISKVKDKSIKERMKAGVINQLEQLDFKEPLKYASLYLPVKGESYTIFDYLSNDSYLIIHDYFKIQQTQDRIVDENQYWIENEVEQGRLISAINYKADLKEIIPHVGNHAIHMTTTDRGLVNLRFETIHTFQYRSMNQFFGQMNLIQDELEHYLKQGYVVQLAANNSRQAEKTYLRFKENGSSWVHLQTETKPRKGYVNIIDVPLVHGFEIVDDKWVVVTEGDLFNRMKQHRTQIRTPQLSNAERIKSYNELAEGDYVVHVDHGIGRYAGIETLEVAKTRRDMITIEYRDNDRVFIPIEKIHLIQKYVGSDDKTPKLHKLGGTDWAKTKKRVQSSVDDIADELITLYAKREKQKGFAFSPDSPEQEEFEQAFPFVETPDQLRSAKEIKQDMEKERPMDRLLVGDVGYGKTEVAMRAIFKAVMDGKQVAFLVPTTILAQQHYNTLIERFNEWPFEIRMLSRFVRPADAKATLEDLESGSVSIVVGTHRILSKDVKFNDLGLLIIDEEQRFGVKHKERIKQLKSQVDVLTLTATPIPRTLHMSMIGIRDLSVIETPPNNRFPVQTYVMEQNEGTIKTGIERELARGGQVFYLYNRVATIYQRADEIGDLVPNARIAVVHGRMKEKELENIVLEFIGGQYDVLVTTTIIETGVDIPNANTLFIERADRMGLATLYQLRGRVGRSQRLAYAYMMYPIGATISEESEKRLEAIKQFTDLGSGFKIAMRDLSIRGAGNILGQQQSGFIDSVGYELYTKMLQEAIEKRKHFDGIKSRVQTDDLVVDLSVNAYIPSEYIHDDRQKIAMYKEIQKIDSREAYRAIQDQLIDRYGEYPDEVGDLLSIVYVRTLAMQVGVTTLKQTRHHLLVEFNELASEKLKGATVFEALQDVPLKAEIMLEQDVLQMKLMNRGYYSYQWLESLIILFEAVHNKINKESEK